MYLKLRPYRQKYVARRRNEKLAPKYFGPFEIIQRIGKAAYKLKLPAESSNHPVFHISQLKKVVGNSTVVKQLTPWVSADMKWITKPEEVYATRTNEAIGKEEALVAWKHLSEEEATWEELDTIEWQFPGFFVRNFDTYLGFVSLRSFMLLEYLE